MWKIPLGAMKCVFDWKLEILRHNNTNITEWIIKPIDALNSLSLRWKEKMTWRGGEMLSHDLCVCMCVCVCVCVFTIKCYWNQIGCRVRRKIAHGLTSKTTCSYPHTLSFWNFLLNTEWIVHPKMKILSLFTHPQGMSKYNAQTVSLAKKKYTSVYF